MKGGLIPRLTSVPASTITASARYNQQRVRVCDKRPATDFQQNRDQMMSEFTRNPVNSIPPDQLTNVQYRAIDRISQIRPCENVRLTREIYI